MITRKTLKKIRTICIGVILIVPALILTIHVVTYIKIQHELRNYLLPSANSSILSLKTLKLYRYWIQTKYDPLFAIPAIHIDDYQHAVDELAASVTKYKPYYTDYEYKLIHEHLYPLQFLATQSETERLRRMFVENPTFKNAENYTNALNTTLTMYEHSAEALASVFNDNISGLYTRPEAINNVIKFVGGDTNALHIAKQLTSITTQADSAQVQNQRRFDCITSQILNCESAKVFGNKTYLDALQDTSDTQMPNYIPMFAEVYANSYHPTNVTEPAPSLIAVANSPCLPSAKPAYLRIWWNNENSKTNIVRSLLVNDILLWDLEIMSETHGYYKARFDQGLQYEVQPINSYMCIDEGQDSSLARNTHYAYTQLHTNPIFVNTDSSDIFETAHKLEQKIVTNDAVMHASLIAQYFSEVEKLLEKHGEQKIASFLTPEKFKQLMAMRLIWKTQSAYQTEDINLHTYLINTSISVLTYDQMGVIDIFFSRSYISALFQTANSSLFNKPINLLESYEMKNVQELKFISYHDTLHTTWSIDDLASYLQKKLTVDELFYTSVREKGGEI